MEGPPSAGSGETSTPRAASPGSVPGVTKLPAELTNLVLELVQRSPAFKGVKAKNAPDLEAHARLGRQAGAEGMVLLENAGVLPLTAGRTLALLGNTSYAMITGGVDPRWTL